jgi:hypothetical protein
MTRVAGVAISRAGRAGRTDATRMGLTGVRAGH